MITQQDSKKDIDDIKKEGRFFQAKYDEGVYKSYGNHFMHVNIRSLVTLRPFFQPIEIFDFPIKRHVPRESKISSFFGQQGVDRIIKHLSPERNSHVNEKEKEFLQYTHPITLCFFMQKDYRNELIKQLRDIPSSKKDPLTIITTDLYNQRSDMFYIDYIQKHNISGTLLKIHKPLSASGVERFINSTIGFNAYEKAGEQLYNDNMLYGQRRIVPIPKEFSQARERFLELPYLELQTSIIPRT